MNDSKELSIPEFRDFKELPFISLITQSNGVVEGLVGFEYHRLQFIDCYESIIQLLSD